MSERWPRVGSAAIVLDDRATRVLLVKRNKAGPTFGQWVLPGGGVRPFERMEQAARREVLEETGLTVKIYGRFGWYEWLDPPTEHRIVCYSLGRPVWEGQAITPGGDATEARFVPVEEFTALDLTPLTGRVLSDLGWNTRFTAFQPKDIDE